MKKTLASMLVLLLLCLPVAPLAQSARVVDNADLLSTEQEQALEERIAALQSAHNFDVLILLEPSIGGADSQAYLDDYYDYNGYGYGTNGDGMAMLVSLEERVHYISGTGSAIALFSDAELSAIVDAYLPYLSSGDYYGAADAFLTCIESALAPAQPPQGEAEPLPQPLPEPMPEPLPEPVPVKTSTAVPYLIVVAGALGIGFLAGGIARGGMNTARRENSAHGYAQNADFRITGQRDLFRYSNVVRTRKPTENNNTHHGGTTTHTGSSGRSHSGTGGKF